MPVTESSVDFDWFSPEACRDPQFYDGLIREAAPVAYSPQYDVWATRAARADRTDDAGLEDVFFHAAAVRGDRAADDPAV